MMVLIVTVRLVHVLVMSAAVGGIGSGTYSVCFAVFLLILGLLLCFLFRPLLFVFFNPHTCWALDFCLVGDFLAVV